jgi:hypothetical protein
VYVAARQDANKWQCLTKRAAMLRSCSALLGCGLIAAATTCASGQSRAAYSVVHSIVANGEEFISVVVRPTISDPELMTAAIELHRLYPQSAVTFYDSMNVPRIKLYWACFVKMMDKLDSPSCTDAVFEWNSDHSIANVLSFYDNPSHTGKPTWRLDRGLRKIGDLGIDDRPVEKPTPAPTSRRPQAGQTVRLQFGQHTVIDTALTPSDYAEFTKCYDRSETTDCHHNLLTAHKVLQVPSGTKAQIVGFQDNPYRAKLLTGALVQVRILEGALRGQVMWTLEDRIAK